MLDLKTAKMPSEPRLYKQVVSFWKEQALAEGLQQGEADLLIRQLTRRFGSLTDNQMEKVRSLPIPQLESLAEAIFDFQDISDLEKWFEE